MMLCAKCRQYRFMISAKTSLLKILPAKVAKVAKTARSRMIGEPFGMTNNFISRFSIE